MVNISYLRIVVAVISLVTVACASVDDSSTVVEADIETQYLPVDSDLDGVVDDNDDCYKTADGVRVDERGCPIIVKDLNEVLLNINFAYDSARIQSGFYPELEQVAEFMLKNPTSRVVIEGHTDSDGSLAYNKSLSKRRAQAAARLLVTKFGVNAIRVTAIGFGEERPVVVNDTEENKAKNRRVVAVIRTLKEKRG